MGINFQDPQPWLSSSVTGVPSDLETRLLEMLSALLRGAGDWGRSITGALYVNVSGAHYHTKDIQEQIQQALLKLDISANARITTKEFWAQSIEVSPPVRKTDQDKLTSTLMKTTSVVEVGWLDGSELIVWTDAPPEALQETLAQVILPYLPKK